MGTFKVLNKSGQGTVVVEYKKQTNDDERMGFKATRAWSLRNDDTFSSNKHHSDDTVYMITDLDRLTEIERDVLDKEEKGRTCYRYEYVLKGSHYEDF